MSGQRSYLVAVVRDGVEQLEGQMVRAASGSEVRVGDLVTWVDLRQPVEGKPQPVPYRVVEIREATEHLEAVVVLRPPG